MPLVTTGLIAEWRFDDGTGQVLTDYSGNSKHGQLGSSSGADAADPAWSGGGLVGDGGDYVILPEGMLGGTGNQAISMMAVVHAYTQTAGFKLIQFLGHRTNLQAFTLAVDGSHQVYGGAWGDTAFVATMPDLPFSLACTYNASSGERRLLINGEYAGSNTTTTAMNFQSSPLARFFHDTSTLVLTGGICFGLLYNSTLSDADVLQNHQYMGSILAGRGITLPNLSLTETLAPTSDVGTPTNATGTWDNVNEGVDAASDGTFIAPTDTSLAMVKRLAYDPLTAGRTLVTGAGLQKVRVKAWKTPGVNTTTLTVTIKRAGGSVLATPINAVSVTNEAGQVLEGTFDATVMTDDTDASEIETEITTAPGSP